jgi:hypothetical protein
MYSPSDKSELICRHRIGPHRYEVLLDVAVPGTEAYLVTCDGVPREWRRRMTECYDWLTDELRAASSLGRENVVRWTEWGVVVFGPFDVVAMLKLLCLDRTDEEIKSRVTGTPMMDQAGQRGWRRVLGLS